MDVTIQQIAELIEKLEKSGFSERDLEKLISSNFLAEDVWQLVHDEIINEQYLGLPYLREEQIEKYRTWNCNLKLGIKEQEFESIPTISGKQLLVPNKDQLFVLILFYESGSIKTFLNGIKILQTEFKEIKIEVEEEILRLKQKNSNESLLAKGFHWLLLELGREALLSSQPEIYADEDDIEKINEIKKRRKKEGKWEIGCEIFYAAALYPAWFHSIGMKPCYPAPICIGLKKCIIVTQDFVYYGNDRNIQNHLNRKLVGIASLVKEIK